MFGEVLKKLRKKNNLTQVQLSEVLNVDKSSVAKWETAGVIPSPDLLKKIADLFAVSIDFLLEREPNQDDISEYLDELHKRPEMKMLFSVAKNVTKEDIEKTVKILEMFRDQSK